MIELIKLFTVYSLYVYFSILTLLVGLKIGHPAHKTCAIKGCLKNHWMKTEKEPTSFIEKMAVALCAVF